MLAQDLARPEYGFFGPRSMAWRVAREVAVPLGGGSRALLMQVAHPKVAAAVADHSRYRSDPIGRLRGTLNAAYGFTFEDEQRARDIVGRINALHGRVRGATADGDPYSALDPHLLLWVYATLLDSSIVAYEAFVAPLSVHQREQFYAEFRAAGAAWGISPEHFPASFSDLRRWMARLIDIGEVHVTAQGREVGRYILEPPLWWLPRPAALAVRLTPLWLLPPSLREGFGYSWGPHRERLMLRLAATSRAVVPHLPPLVRDLPIARAADRRVWRGRSG